MRQYNMKTKRFFYSFFLCATVLLMCSFAVLTLKPLDAHNAVTFVIKNLGINTRGEFTGLKGDIEWNEEDPTQSKFSVSVAANTINTGIDSRDNHLKKEEYFDVKNYPEIKITSNAISKADEGFLMNATLLIKGVTKTVSFPFTAEKQPDGGLLFTGKFTVNRRDFGVGGNSVTLSDNVDVILNVMAK